MGLTPPFGAGLRNFKDTSKDRHNPTCADIRPCIIRLGTSQSTRAQMVACKGPRVVCAVFRLAALYPPKRKIKLVSPASLKAGLVSSKPRVGHIDPVQTHLFVSPVAPHGAERSNMATTKTRTMSRRGDAMPPRTQLPRAGQTKSAW